MSLRSAAGAGWWPAPAISLLALLILAALAMFMPAAPPARAQQQEDPIKWSITSEQAGKALKAGAAFKAELVAEIAEGWHLYAMEQPNEGPRPTRITLPSGQVFALDGEIDAPGPVRTMDPNFGFETDYYEGSAAFTLPLRALETASAGRHRLAVQVRFQTCTQEICLPPKTQKLELEFEIEK